MIDPQAVVHYWLGDTERDPGAVREKSRMWYSSIAAVDQEIDAKFGEALGLAEKCKLPSWLESPTGQLASVILLDQFTRNLNRGSKLAWKNDGTALAIAEKCVDGKDYLSLSYFGRVFLYHPYHHAESLSAQENGKDLFEELYNEVPVDWQAPLKGFVDFAKSHREIIRRFGRFPHRNETLGRKSSSEEIAYLLENRKNYGQ
jgi:uncharacterized protein (DUF924 family)